MSKRKRHSAAEISAKLDQAATLAAEGKNQHDIARALDVSVMTLHRWRKAEPISPHATTSREIVPASQLSEEDCMMRISHLQLENTRLRKLVTDLLLEKIQLEDEVQHPNGQVPLKKVAP